MSYYGVYAPPKFDISAAAASTEDKKPLVFSTREEAFKALKSCPDGRVKGFANREDAAYFAQNGQDLLNATTNQSFNDSSKLKSPSSALNPEKAAFRGPKIQEMVEFRKAIESGNLTIVHNKIMENPRFLIGSGDTPAILKEGTRYNAMHVAAISKNPKMCELILSTLKPSYVQLFHGGRQTKEVSEEVAAKLLDLYLNMPEKGRFETPLHLAVKNGAADVVEVLTSYPQCRQLPNSDQKLPRDLVCFRVPNAAPELKDRIAQLLEERFFVPVLRSTDGTVAPVIGQPFSVRNMPMNLSGGSGGVVAFGGENKSPLLTPELQIRAYAGPMDQEQAESFRRRWRTPPATSLNGSSLLNGSAENVLMMRSPLKASGSKQAAANRLLLAPPKSPVNFMSTPKGKTGKSLRSIDEFILDTEGPKKTLFGNLSPLRGRKFINGEENDEAEEDPLDASFRERHVKLTDNEKGLEVVGRLLAKEQNVGWSEYWNFLDNFTNLTTTQGLQQLEQHLKARQEQERRGSGQEEAGEERKRGSFQKQEKLNISDICDRLTELHLNNQLKRRDEDQNNNQQRDQDNQRKENQQQQQQLNAFLCVEKSFQIYARRAMKILNNHAEVPGLLSSTLTAELVRLESLVCSYKEDQRFRRIEFSVAHSRFAHLVLNFLLEDVQTYRMLLPKLKRSLVVAAEEEKLKEKEHLRTTTTTTSGHLKCLAQFLLTYAENEEEKIRQVVLDKLVSEEDCAAVWRDENKCSCSWTVPKGQAMSILGGAGPNVKNPHVMRMRDKNKKKRINDLIKRKIEFAQAGEVANNQTNGAMWEYRNKLGSHENDEDVWADSVDSDHSFDSTDSEECFFYTPVESPSEFLTASDRSEEEEEEDGDSVDGGRRVRRVKKREKKENRVDLQSYRNYILGDEATKTDVDVFNAICDVEIDEATYPHLSRWKEAISMYSMEEIQNFPSLSMIVRQSIPICKLESPSPLSGTGRKLFASPMKLPVSR